MVVFFEKGKRSKIIYFILGVILLFVVGFFRELTFIVINRIIANKSINSLYGQKLKLLLENFQIENLILFKYFLTAFSCLLFASLTYLILFKILSKSPLKQVAIFYASFVAIGLIVSALGYLLNIKEAGYMVTRQLIGYLQGPIPLFLLVILFQFVIPLNRKE
jgi:hypothetical protein